jgi:penicillin-binding protein 2
LIYKRRRTGHDDLWENYARNAIRGSCNIYFSRLADRIEPIVLQQWLFKFGYGRVSPLVARDWSRELRQAPGQISTIPIAGTTNVSSFEQIPPLSEGERRLFGIGQGNMRVTPIQVANAMAAIARNGIFKKPRLFKETKNSELKTQDFNDVPLGISEETLAVIYDGMRAVVNEPGGTAYNEFVHSGLSEQGITVYGKTGSTEDPEHACFAGFAEDSVGRKLSIAVVVENGQSGSRDAAPLARDIIQFCIEAGYIGQSLP